MIQNMSVTPDTATRELVNLHPYINHWVSVSACTSAGCFQENTVHCKTLELGNKSLSDF